MARGRNQTKKGLLCLPTSHLRIFGLPPWTACTNTTEAISFMVYCDDQDEIDYYWEKLSAVPESEQCGWLKDKFGVSWQIVPDALGKMMSEGTKEQIAKVTEAFLKMKKFDIATLQKTYAGE